MTPARMLHRPEVVCAVTPGPSKTSSWRRFAWPWRGGRLLVALAGAVAGVIGCANALASGLTGRHYAPARHQRNILE